MAQFLAYGLASERILQALHGRERPRNRTACRRRFPAGERVVPGLRVVMSQPVHVIQAGHSALCVVGMPLLNVETISAERRKLMQVHSLLHCLSEVLLHADGEDAILYAQVAQLGAELLDDSVARLEQAA